MRSPLIRSKGRRHYSSDTKPGILIVDDNQEDRYFLLRALKTLELACPIQVVSNGEEAISYLSGKAPFENQTRFPIPHLLLLDLKMPGKDGFQVLQWLKRQSALDGLNVVVLSDSNQDSDIAKARELGAEDCLYKSSNMVDLVHNIREVTFKWLS